MTLTASSSDDGGITLLFIAIIAGVIIWFILGGIRNVMQTITSPETPPLDNVHIKVDTTLWHVNSAKVSAIEYDITHGMDKHGVTQQELADKCFENSNLKLTYAKSFNEDRRVNLCLSLNNYLAIQVLEKIGGKWHEITKYVNFNLTSIDDMIDYFVTDSGKYGYITYLSDIMKQFVLSIFP